MAPVYEQFIPTLTWRAKHLSDKLPWRAVAAPGVILNKTGALQRTYAIQGPDLSHETQEAQGALMLQANEVLKRLKGSWTLHSEAQRVPVTTYPETLWPQPVARLIDADRRHAILVNPGSFETFYFFTLTWQPPPAITHQLERLVVKRPATEVVVTPEQQQAKRLETFLTQADYWLYLLRGMLAQARPLTTNETATYLKTTVSPRWTPVVCRWPLDLDVRLADTRVVGGWYPYWDDGPDEHIHFRVCSLTGYPESTTAATMRAMYRLGFPFRLVTRGIALDKHLQAGLLRKMQGNWYGQRIGIFGRMAESMSQKESAIQNSDARNKAEQADAARQEIGEDIVAYLNFSMAAVVWDRDPEVANRRLTEVRQVLESQGFGTTFEKQHAFPVWLSTHPGNRVDGVRKTPQNSLMLADVCPGLQAAWTGPTRDEHLNEGPWFHAHTDDSTILRVVNHVRDNGLFKVVGPTRTGKSVLLGMMTAQWLNGPKKRAYVFDVDGSARCLTHCMGGHWYDLGSGHIGLQPYRRVDEETQRAWLYEWTLRLIEKQGVGLTDGVRRTVRDALDVFPRAKPHERTMTELVIIVTGFMRHTEGASRNPLQPFYERMKTLAAERSAVVNALTLYTRGQLLGHLLDADHDDLADGPFHTFEQRTLLNTPSLVDPVMSYVFHELEQRASTEYPTLVPMDDAAVTWAIPDYETKGKEWMVTKAKKNWSLGFFTHSLQQVFGSPLGTLLIESCPTTFALPNREALAPAIHAIYERLGFNHLEIQQIAKARPQRDCYYSCEEWGKRLFSVPLSPQLLAIFARNRAEDHQRMDEILAQEGREGFGEAWMREQGFPESAVQLQAWRQAMMEVEDAAD
jgi:type IV secretion system protein TrbE